MAQPFRRYANTVARVGYFAALVGPFVFLVAATEFMWSPYGTQANVAKAQPVQFSHKHHVTDLGIDCRYCHTSVEDSSFANIPPLHTCMTCHSQIWLNSGMLAPVRDSYASGVPLEWTRVHQLPDFVYFNHSIHVNKGIGCSTCHGRVDQMNLVRPVQALFMAWCLHCHRDPARNVRPKSEIFNMAWQPARNQELVGARLVRQYHIRKLDDCYVCHR
jgi:hypothetical protein